MKEEIIEYQICQYLESIGGTVVKNDIKGFYDHKRNIYRRNKSRFIRKGISDITWLYKGTHYAIEVKTPKEMNFFDREMQDLKDRFAKAYIKGVSKKALQKYEHAIEQKQYLLDIEKDGGVGFFADSIHTLKKSIKNICN